MADFTNGFHALMYSVWEILDKVDQEQDRYSMNAFKLGKLIKRQKLKSKHTLNPKEIHYYTLGLIEIYKNWARYGHNEWAIKEKEMSASFTVVFLRKERS